MDEPVKRKLNPVTCARTVSAKLSEWNAAGIIDTNQNQNSVSCVYVLSVSTVIF